MATASAALPVDSTALLPSSKEVGGVGIDNLKVIYTWCVCSYMAGQCLVSHDCHNLLRELRPNLQKGCNRHMCRQDRQEHILAPGMGLESEESL